MADKLPVTPAMRHILGELDDAIEAHRKTLRMLIDEANNFLGDDDISAEHVLEWFDTEEAALEAVSRIRNQMTNLPFTGMALTLSRMVLRPRKAEEVPGQ